MTQVISQKDLLAWLGSLAKDRIVIAPVREGDVVLFQPMTKAEDIVLNYDITALSPKNCFFPPSEAILTIDRKNGGYELVPAPVEKQTVLFGLHPCDALGIEILDKAYLAEPADTLYQERRSKTTLVGLACAKACPECFCTSMCTAPDDSSRLDILLTETADGYIVQAVTDKGKSLLAGAPLKESQVKPPAPPAVSPVPAKDIVESMRQNFESAYWSRLADRCIHCNICSYVCPVCYCFDMRDFSDKGKTERVRTWESCQSAYFTKIAGGYDPRAAKAARLRQRFYHKLLYMPEKFSAMGCTGCGRCVRSCPVNIDIREIIADVNKLGAKSGS